MAIIRLCEPLSRKSLWIAALSELIGTFLLVFVGVGLMWINFSHPDQNTGVSQQSKFVIAGAGFGLTVGGIVFIMGFGFPHGSAHINPAVTLGCLVLDKITVFRAAIFVVAQCIGAIGGAFVLWSCIDNMRATAFGCTVLSDGTSKF